MTDFSLLCAGGEGVPVNVTGSYSNLILFAFVAIGFSFFCSVAEAVLLSVTPSYMATLKEKGAKAAVRLENLKANVDRPLAAILSLNTIAHTVGAAGVGAVAQEIWGSQAVAWASAIMTLLILVLSEIIPKTIGAVYWRTLAPSIAIATQGLIWMLYPLVWISEFITRAIGSPGHLQIVSREEVEAMAKLSAEGGAIPERESLILGNLFKLDSLTVRDIMTPRTVIIAFSEDMTVQEVMEQASRIPVSRIPVYQESIDRVTGFVLRSDIFLASAKDEHTTTLQSLRRELKAVPVTAPLTTLFELLIHQKQHIAVVIDEYGGTDGLVTMEDLLETLLGLEIVDEHDSTVDMQRLARRKWEQRARSLGLVNDEATEPNASRDASATEPEQRPE